MGSSHHGWRAGNSWLVLSNLTQYCPPVIMVTVPVSPAWVVLRSFILTRSPFLNCCSATIFLLFTFWPHSKAWDIIPTLDSGFQDLDHIGRADSCPWENSDGETTLPSSPLKLCWDLSQGQVGIYMDRLQATAEFSLALV